MPTKRPLAGLLGLAAVENAKGGGLVGSPDRRPAFADIRSRRVDGMCSELSEGEQKLWYPRFLVTFHPRDKRHR